MKSANQISADLASNTKLLNEIEACFEKGLVRIPMCYLIASYGDDLKHPSSTCESVINIMYEHYQEHGTIFEEKVCPD